jgi:hypothetical protein
MRHALALALALAPLAAHAQNAPRPARWHFSAEVGAGTMLHDFDHDALSLATPTVMVTYGRFVRERRAISLAAGTAGVRVEPRVGAIGHLRFDANVGVFLPGSVARPGYDLGAAFEFDLTEHLSVGPFARFAHVIDGREGYATADLPYVAQPAQDTDSIQWWTAGLAITLHERPKRPRAERGPAAPPPAGESTP